MGLVEIGGVPYVGFTADGLTERDVRFLANVSSAHALFEVHDADLPYGVQHGARAAGARPRRPLDLLAAALPGWTRLFRPGGALGPAWNAHVASRDELGAALAGAGLDVVESEPYLRFRQRLDQAIVSDLVAARRP